MLAYLADIFSYINNDYTNMQGHEENILTSTDKFLAFQKIIVMWKRKVTENNFEMFQLIQNNATTTLAPIISEHLIVLKDKINKYFPEIEIVNYDWIRNPFSSLCTSNFNLTLQEKEELISISADRSLKIKFSEESIEEFWISMKEQF
jgi:hypothetical protein